MRTYVETILWRLATGFTIAFSAMLCIAAETESTQQLEFFEQRVRPLLVEHCYSCHAGKKRQGGLSLEHRAGWQAGGDRGSAVVPGRPDESLVLQAVRYEDDFLQMPPDGKWSDEEIDVLESWLRMGGDNARNGGVVGAESNSYAMLGVCR